MKYNLEEIKVQVERLASKIRAPKLYLPTFGYSDDGARPHIEVTRDGHLYYVIVERGEELKRDLCVNSDDLLYKVFSDITSAMASDFEVKHRIQGEDFRRQMFAKQEDLLRILNSEWKHRKENEHRWILRSHPFSDR